jgi:hypothetical protein
MLSSGPRRQDPDYYRQLGIGSVLSKPVRKKDFLSAIGALLSGQAAETNSAMCPDARWHRARGFFTF